MIIRLVLLLAVSIPAFSLPACPAGTQFGGGGGGDTTQRTWNFPAPRPFFGGAVTGAPYSEQHTQQTVQLVAAGGHLTQQPSISPMQYRDSSGRSRIDARMANLGPQSVQRIVTLAQIEDPVAGYQYVLDPVHHIAYRVPYCTAAPMQPLARAAGSPPGGAMPMPSAESEDLGTKTMFGVTVSGRRISRTYPPGSYRGNDVPVQEIIERWTSPQYGEFLNKTTEPESERTNSITTFNAAEPDPALFHVPAGYQIVDETAPFTVTIHYDQ